jgi:hypothetical protein
MIDEAQGRGVELLETVEDAVSKHAPLDEAEKQLDLIDPRRVDRRVVEVKPTSVPTVELRPPTVISVVVDVQVVPDDASTIAPSIRQTIDVELDRYLWIAVLACPRASTSESGSEKKHKKPQSAR